MIFFLLIPLFLILLQGVFAASETGLISLENSQITKEKNEGKRWAVIVTRFLDRPENFFSTILICENFIIVVASTLMANFFVSMIGNSGAIISTIVLSLFSLAVGLFIPKSLALYYPAGIMRILSRPIYYLEKVTYPIVYIFANTAKGIALIFRSKSDSATIQRSDIIYAMSEYEEKASMFAQRLFNFSKRNVEEVMIPLDTVFLCKKGEELQLLKYHYKRLYTRIPVYHKRREEIIGIFNIKDYFYTNKVTLRKPFFINKNARCMSIFSTMKQKGQHMGIVRDDSEKAIGIVTLEDLIEELVGEIRDER